MNRSIIALGTVVLGSAGRMSQTSMNWIGEIACKTIALRPTGAEYPATVNDNKWKQLHIMGVVTARESRANQGRFLQGARNGQSVILTSR